MKSDVDWQSGEEIVLGGWGIYEAEKRTIANVEPDKKTVNLKTPLNYKHWSEKLSFGLKQMNYSNEGNDRIFLNF